MFFTDSNSKVGAQEVIREDNNSSDGYSIAVSIEYLPNGNYIVTYSNSKSETVVLPSNFSTEIVWFYDIGSGIQNGSFYSPPIWQVQGRLGYFWLQDSGQWIKGTWELSLQATYGNYFPYSDK